MRPDLKMPVQISEPGVAHAEFNPSTAAEHLTPSKKDRAMKTNKDGTWRHPFAPRTPVFLSLPTSELNTLNGLGMERSFAAGQALFREDDPAKHVYRVLEGRIKIIATSSAGRAHIVRVLYPGDVLGMSAVLAKAPHEVEAIAFISTIVARIHADQFLSFLESSPIGIACVANALSEEYLDIAGDAKILQIGNGIQGRVARVLLACAPADECRLPFPLVFTHDDLADMANCSRESVTRTFSLFKKHAFIHTSSELLTILQPERLVGIAGLN